MPRKKTYSSGGLIRCVRDLQEDTADRARAELIRRVVEAQPPSAGHAVIEGRVDHVDTPIKLKIVSDGRIGNTHVIDEETGRRVANVTSIEMNLRSKDVYVRVQLGLVNVKLEMDALSNISGLQRRLLRFAEESEPEEEITF